MYRVVILIMRINISTFWLCAPLLVCSSWPWEAQVGSGSIWQSGDHSSLLTGSDGSPPPNPFTLMGPRSLEDDKEELIYEGCFRDDLIRDLPMQQLKAMRGVTGCRIACKGYKFFGLQSGTECWCGNNQLRRYNRLQGSDCGKQCPGEVNLTPKRFCGATFLNAIYRVREKAVSTDPLISLDLNDFMDHLFGDIEQSTVRSPDCVGDVDNYCSETRSMHCLAMHAELLSDACRHNVEKAVPVDCKSELSQLDCNGFEIPKLSCLLQNIYSLSLDCRDDVLAAKALVVVTENSIEPQWQCPNVYRLRSQGNCCALGGQKLTEECCASFACSSAALDACAEQRCLASGGAWNASDDGPMCCPPAPDDSGGFLSIQVIGLALIAIFLFLVARSPVFVLGTAVGLGKQGFNHYDYGSLESKKDPNGFDAI